MHMTRCACAWQIDVTKALLFADDLAVKHGYVFALTVTRPDEVKTFWAHKLDNTRWGTYLQFQVHALEDEPYYRECCVRGELVDNKAARVRRVRAPPSGGDPSPPRHRARGKERVVAPPPPAGEAGTSGHGATKGGRRSVEEEFADAALQLEQNE